MGTPSCWALVRLGTATERVISMTHTADCFLILDGATSHRKAVAQFALSALQFPILDREARHPIELARVVRNNDEAMRQGYGRNLSIVGADGRPCLLQVSAQASVRIGGCFVKA